MLPYVMICNDILSYRPNTHHYSTSCCSFISWPDIQGYSLSNTMPHGIVTPHRRFLSRPFGRPQRIHISSDVPTWALEIFRALAKEVTNFRWILSASGLRVCHHPGGVSSAVKSPSQAVCGFSTQPWLNNSRHPEDSGTRLRPD